MLMQEKEGTRGTHRRDLREIREDFLEKTAVRLRSENEIGINLLKRRGGNNIVKSREHSMGGN